MHVGSFFAVACIFPQEGECSVSFLEIYGMSPKRLFMITSVLAPGCIRISNNPLCPWVWTRRGEDQKGYGIGASSWCHWCAPQECEVPCIKISVEHIPSNFARIDFHETIPCAEYVSHRGVVNVFQPTRGSRGIPATWRGNCDKTRRAFSGLNSTGGHNPELHTVWSAAVTNIKLMWRGLCEVV